MTELSPIYLLADSRPLFLNQGSVSLLSRIKADIDKSTIKAAYVGGSCWDRHRNMPYLNTLSQNAILTRQGI